LTGPVTRCDPTTTAGLAFLRNTVAASERDTRTLREPLGHKDAKTTMISAYVLNHGGKGLRSPVEDL